MSGLGWTLQTAWTIYGMFSAKKQLFIKRNKDIKSEEEQAIQWPKENGQTDNELRLFKKSLMMPKG
jgi:hypothetical protein